MDLKYKNLLRYNLATWYLLPLLGMNPNFFGGLENFINCYVNTEGTLLFVSIHSPEFTDAAMESPFYLKDKHEETTTEYFMIFSLSECWQDDFVRFMSGEYSKFTDEAKEAIRLWSGLPYKQTKEGGEYGATITDLRILALSTDPIDRDNLATVWAEMLNSEMPDPDKELLAPPTMQEFIELEP